MPPTAKSDIDSFCRTHWWRLFNAANHRVHDEHEAQDAVQELFMHLIQQKRLVYLMRELQPDHQIAFLLKRLNWLLHNRWRDKNRRRRGGGMALVSLLDDSAAQIEPVDHRTPAHHLDAAWVYHIIETALTRLRDEVPSGTWKALENSVCHGTTTPGKPKSTALRVALHRARQRLQWLITREVPGATCPKDANAQLLSALH